jgi:hypothetical protein
MSTWVGTDGTYIYNLDQFAEIGVETRQDGIFLIRAWSQTAAVSPDGTRYARGEAVTLAELTTMADVDQALAFLRRQVCTADFQTWGGEG